ncbi:MAG: hypothetical protein Q7T62_12980 [Undibacterium sp.]|nr:hypothetical protein [Undibacterium sp.]
MDSYFDGHDTSRHRQDTPNPSASSNTLLKMHFIFVHEKHEKMQGATFLIHFLTLFSLFVVRSCLSCFSWRRFFFYAIAPQACTAFAYFFTTHQAYELAFLSEAPGFSLCEETIFSGCI